MQSDKTRIPWPDKWRNVARFKWSWRVHSSDCPYGYFLRISSNAMMGFTVGECTCSRLRRFVAFYRKPYEMKQS